MSRVPITLAPPVARKLALERALTVLGKKWLLHPANYVHRLPKPLEPWRARP